MRKQRRKWFAQVHMLNLARAEFELEPFWFQSPNLCPYAVSILDGSERESKEINNKRIRYLENCKDSCKETKPVKPKGSQPWIFIGRTDAEAEAPMLWPPDAKSQLTGKDPDSGKDWGQEEKGTTEDKMIGWHHRPNEHEFEQTLGDSEGQGSLVCCSPVGHKESDTT